MNWIKTKQRLPDFDVPVLVHCDIYGAYITTLTRIESTDVGQWLDHEGNPGGLPPTDWMPLPKIPANHKMEDV